MSAWTDRAVRLALGWTDGRDDLGYERIVTDSRTIRTGDLFVALEGERFDGHRFLDAVQRAGATGAVVRAGTPPVAGLRLYEVDDTLRAYGWLARSRRRRIEGPVVAITGTNGKTSTKELLSAVLGTRDRVWATRANLNNLVGVPQTILEAPAEANALVIEAGANLVGEIARYRDIIEPTITVVTNVAAGHLEGFGSLEGVLAEKIALVDGVALAVVGTEPTGLATEARTHAHRVITAGLEQADVMPRVAIGLPDGRTDLEVDGHRFILPLIGRHQAANAMLAWAVGRELGLDRHAVAEALGRVAIPGGRGELAQHERLTVLNDCYNANPASFRAAIDTAATLRAGRRLVFVVGTMRELGPDAARFHAEIAKRLVELDPDLLAAVGEFVPALEPYRASLGDRLVTAPDAPAIGPLVAARLDGTELVVLKGSRGVALERILPDLLARTSPEAHA